MTEEKFFNGVVHETRETMLIRIYALCYKDSVKREDRKEQIYFLGKLRELGVTDIAGMIPSMIREKYIAYEVPWEVVR